MEQPVQTTESSILVVDDAPENVMLLSLILKDLGTIRSALSGKDAIRMVKEDAPDLILLDIQMPEMDGYEVFKALRADPASANVPVIFVTGLSQEADEEKGLELGAIDYITKPYKPAVVTARVRNHLRLREYAMRLEQMNEELERLATTDVLTSAYNRRYFMGKLEEEVRRVTRYKRPSSLLMLDIDHFKQVNDTYGHDVGDRVLKRLVEIMEAEFRQFDTVARLGGEEFAVLLPETPYASAIVSAERFLDRVRKCRIPVGDKELSFTVSIGCVEFDCGTANSERILKNADVALYQAKNSGRNRVVGHEAETAYL